MDKEEKIVNLKIYEAGNKLHTGIVKYGDTVTIKVTSRNLVGEELELKVRESVWGSDRKLSEIIKIKIDEEGKGEAPFTIPKGWKDYGDPCTVRKYYLEYKGQEFPRAYYVANPNKTEEENKANSNRIEALMLKVSDDLSLDKKLETENAVVLGSEPEFVKLKKLVSENGECYCNRDLTVKLIKKVVKRISGKNSLWNGMTVKGVHYPCNIDNKSFESFTEELNDAFKRHGITTCIQKISFLAQSAAETNFQQNYEMPSRFASSGWKYKGRGIIQLTGSDSSPGIYKKYANASHINNPNIIDNPDLLSISLYYTIDSSVWYFKQKRVPTWSVAWKGENSKYDHLRKQRLSRFSNVLGENLSELSKFNHKSIRYFWLQCKMIHGYLQKDTFRDHPNGWEKRHKSLNQIKSEFGFLNCINNNEKIELNNRAPWMKIAIEEAQIAAGCKEEIEPMLSMGYKYLKFAGSSASPANDETGQWCASYLSWCIKQSGHDVHPVAWKRSNSQEFRFIAQEGEVYKKIEEPIFGALAVYTKYKDDKHGHIGFVFGKTTNNEVILLGGNQKDTIKCDSFGKKTKTKFLNGYYVPIDYNITKDDYLTSEDIYDNSSDANFKLGIYVNEKDKNSANKTS